MSALHGVALSVTQDGEEIYDNTTTMPSHCAGGRIVNGGAVASQFRGVYPMNEDTRSWKCLIGMHLCAEKPVQIGEWSRGGLTYTDEKGYYQTLRCEYCGGLKTFYQQERFE